MQESVNASKVSSSMAALLAANATLRTDIEVLNKKMETSVELLSIEMHKVGNEVKVEVLSMKDILVSQLKEVNKALGKNKI